MVSKTINYLICWVSGLQYIAMQLYMMVDTPLRYVANEIWHSLSTRTTAFMTTLHVSPKSLKCNISITNCPIALKSDTGVNHQKVHTLNCQWLDRHPTAFVTTLPVFPNSLKCNFSINKCSIALTFCHIWGALMLNPGERKFQGSKTSSQSRHSYNKGKITTSFSYMGHNIKKCAYLAIQVAHSNAISYRENDEMAAV